MGNSSKRDIRTLERLQLEQRIVTMRRAGYSFDLIAEELKYSNASGPWKVYQGILRRMRELTELSVDDYRDEFEGQLRAIMRGGLYQKAQKGELAAIDRFLRLQESLRNLRGIDAPKATKNEVNVTGTVQEATPEAAARLVREMFGDHAAKELAPGELPAARAAAAAAEAAPTATGAEAGTDAARSDGPGALPEKPPAKGV